MSYKIAINGFGRIGRLCLRSLIELDNQALEVVAINDLGDVNTNAHLLKYDSVHGKLNADVIVKSDNLISINGRDIHIIQEPKVANIDWSQYNVDIVYECTGALTDRSKAGEHISSGAKKVLISAPASNADLTTVYGVNHSKILSSHNVVSNASCTTNCIAPVAHVLLNAVGILNGYVTTVHSYTADQRLCDKGHKDLRRARAASLSMIPTTTGAAKATGLVIPQLVGKLNGCSIRVPTANVSLIDMTFNAERPTNAEDINAALKEAAEGSMKGVIEYTEEPLVSVDYMHNAHSAIFDGTQTSVTEGSFVRIMAWYDNEWGFANRMHDTALVMLKA